MTMLRPHKEWSDWWEYRLWASAGRSNYEVLIYEDNSTEIGVEGIVMGQPKDHYILYGQHSKISPDYGSISIENIQKTSPENEVNDLNLQDFQGGILFEYFRVTKSPHIQHLHDMLEMARDIGNAGWNGYFDMYFVVSPFVAGVIEGIHYAHDNPNEGLELNDIEAVKETQQLIQRLDKCKFWTVKKSSN